jgi:hypothetical protein
VNLRRKGLDSCNKFTGSFVLTVDMLLYVLAIAEITVEKQPSQCCGSIRTCPCADISIVV